MQTSPLYRLRGLEHLDVKYVKRITTPPIYFCFFSSELNKHWDGGQAGEVISLETGWQCHFCGNLTVPGSTTGPGDLGSDLCFFLCEAWMPLFSDLYHRNGYLQVVSGMRVLPSPIQRDVKQWWIFLAKETWVWNKRWSTIKVETSRWNLFFSVSWMRNGGPRGR